ncbi:MAG: 4Fe-4S dicluster domain-containing protein [Anaerolineae bacterium]|nr:4Fe-4S dicluster domain-containing protein [Anaerolineae bacterium]MBL6966273.1 4Fe-4S dicluster domain-containing protein [Anaerolineales bacterium]
MKKQPDSKFSRREFLRIAGGASSVGLLYWLLRPAQASAALLPPGAQDSTIFKAICIRCGKCVAACEQKAINFDEAGFPFMDALQGWCDFSGDCTKACPTAALLPFNPDIAKIGTAVIDTDRCIAWNLTCQLCCGLCIRVCDELQQAIYRDEDGNPHIDPVRCNGCGACVTICPRSAYADGNPQRGKAVSIQSVNSVGL